MSYVQETYRIYVEKLRLAARSAVVGAEIGGFGEE